MTYIFSIIILWLLATAEAFQGIGHGREVRRDSERGLASRQSAAADAKAGLAATKLLTD